MNSTATTKPAVSGKTLFNFLSKLTPSTNGKCLLFTGARTKGGTGYGLFHNGEKMELAHRFAYKLWNDTVIPENMYCLHSCDTPNCVSKKCLSTGTAKDNSADMKARNRSTKGSKKTAKRFSEKEKDQIRALSLSGSSQYAIAKLFNRSEPTISHVLKSKPKPKPSPTASGDAAVMKETGKRLAKVYRSLGEQLERELKRAA